MTKAEAEKLRAKGSNRRGLGVAPYCLPEKSLADNVTYAAMYEELARLREAVALLANCLGAHVIDHESARRLTELLSVSGEVTR